jgi:phage host-nuclease inhibitor protein Gam
MTAKRVKKQVFTGVTRQEADEAFARFAEYDAKEQKTVAQMDEQITKIREKHQDALKECADKKAASFDLIQAYATENRDTLFAKKKSMETPHGVFGFRTGTPKLKTLKGFTWPAVVKLLKIHLEGYVRVSEEAAKDLLLYARNNEEVASLFPSVGVFVDQEETFFVECKKEEALS